MLRSNDFKETFWFVTPQEPSDETQHTAIEKRIYQRLIALQKLERLNPQDNHASRDQFLSNFD